jgi:hypothetical protein
MFATKATWIKVLPESCPLSPSDRLPVQNLQHAVRCLTVYPHHPTVTYALTLQELSRVLDLPAGLALDSPCHPACSAAPAKLL